MLKQIPAVVIQQGTLILEDRLVPGKPVTLEINDISLTLINDPLPRITIRGAANSELLGKLHLQGSLDRLTSEAYVAFRASQIPLTRSLLARLPHCPSEIFDFTQLSRDGKRRRENLLPSGPAALLRRVHRSEERNRRSSKGAVEADRTERQAPLQERRAANGIAHRPPGATEISAHGAALLPCIDQEFEVHLDLKHVVLGPELAKKLPDKIRNLQGLFQPNGPTGIHIACAKHEGQWTTLADGKPSLASLCPEGISLQFKGFPYPLRNTTGTIDYNIANESVDVSLVSYAGDRPVILKGNWAGEKDNADVKFDIHATDIPIDDKVYQALHTDQLHAPARRRPLVPCHRQNRRQRQHPA